MSLPSAVLHIDHHNAQILEFDADHVAGHHLHAQHHYTRQHQSEVRTEHAFFAEVCDALAGVKQVLVTGPHTGLAAFRHYVEKHRPHAQKQMLAWDVVDRMSEAQLLAFARQRLAKLSHMAAPAV